MAKRNTTTMELKLLSESIWNIEDKVNVILESITDHEIELLRLKRLTNLCLQRRLRQDEKDKINRKGKKK